jgi:hypothetical protein
MPKVQHGGVRVHVCAGAVTESDKQRAAYEAQLAVLKSEMSELQAQLDKEKKGCASTQRLSIGWMDGWMDGWIAPNSQGKAIGCCFSCRA